MLTASIGTEGRSPIAGRCDVAIDAVKQVSYDPSVPCARPDISVSAFHVSAARRTVQSQVSGVQRPQKPGEQWGAFRAQSVPAFERFRGDLPFCLSCPMAKKVDGSLKAISAGARLGAGLWRRVRRTRKRLWALMGHSSIQMTCDTYGHFTTPVDDHAKFAACALALVH
jgi:hypothetical protein